MARTAAKALAFMQDEPGTTLRCRQLSFLHCFQSSASSHSHTACFHHPGDARNSHAKREAAIAVQTEDSTRGKLVLHHLDGALESRSVSIPGQVTGTRVGMAKRSRRLWEHPLAVVCASRQLPRQIADPPPTTVLPHLHTPYLPHSAGRMCDRRESCFVFGNLASMVQQL
jgi:hypothetical protein